MRFGLHSGPVTAGVLKGEKARFQLFGDTMNTASRMESTGIPNQIQLSGVTAAILQSSGKGDWLTEREELVPVKGKGEMQTFWLVAKNKQNRRLSEGASFNSFSKEFLAPQPNIDISIQPILAAQESVPWGECYVNESFYCRDGDAMRETDDRHNRLIDWNVTLLLDLLKKIVSTTKINSRVIVLFAEAFTLIAYIFIVNPGCPEGQMQR